MHGSVRADGAAMRAPLPPGAVAQAFRTTFFVYVATAAVFLVANLLGRVDMSMAARVAVPMLIGDAVLDIPLVLLTVRACHQGWGRGWLLVVLLGLAVAVAQMVYDTEVRVAVGALSRDKAPMKMSNSLPVDIYNTGLLVALIAFQAAYDRAVAQSRALAELGTRERRASLAALRLQLNPHFLFNAMNALSSLVVLRRNADAEMMIDRLSAFLRQVTAVDPAALERLDQEFALTEEYLAIEQIRFGARLMVEIDLPPALAAVRVPPFLLQPLVENAVKYAVTPAQQGVLVRLSARRDAGSLWLEVCDDGACDAARAPCLPPGTGVGLANVRERLALHYGPAASLAAGPVPGGYLATISLPIDSARDDREDSAR